MFKLYALFALPCLLALSQPLPPAFSISTYAGAHSPGDDGPAVKAQIHAPWGLTFDQKGNLYLCDMIQERIRRIEPDGTVRWAAGAPMRRLPPYNFSEGPADRVFLNYPQFMTTAPDGAIWFTTSGNLYRLNADGTLSNVAGRGYSSKQSPDGTKAREAYIVNPRAIAVDVLGRVYFAEYEKYTVRRVSADGVIETIAGTGANASTGDGGPAVKAAFRYISDLEFDSAGNLYVCTGDMIRKIDAAGNVTRYAGDPNASYGVADGPALSTSIIPSLFKFGPDGQSYVMEPFRLLKIDSTGRISVVPTPVGTIHANVNDFAVDAEGNIWISDDEGTGRIIKINPQGKAEVAAGGPFYNGDEIPAIDALLGLPGVIAPDARGGFVFTDLINKRLRSVDGDGIIHTLAGPAKPFITASVTAADTAGNTLFYSEPILYQLSSAGKVTALAGKSDSGSSAPKEGELAVSQPIRYPTTLAYDPQGRVLFADSATIWRIEADGRLYRLAGTGVAGVSSEKGPARDLKLSNPKSLVYFQETLYFIDGARIKQVNPDGTMETIAGGGTDTSWWTAGRLSPAATANASAYGITVTPDGAIYGVTSNDFIYRIRPDRFVERIGGDGSPAFSGDGGPALLASVKVPLGITNDAQGNLYIGDGNNYRIRKLTPLTAAVLRKTTGDEQTAIAGKPFELPMEVEAAAENGIAVPMVPLEVTIVEGAATLDKGASTTGANGRLSIKVTAQDAGPLVIQVAAAGCEAVQFRLTVQPDVPPVPEVPTLAAYAEPVAPGSIVILSGEKLSYTGKVIATTEADLIEGRVPESLSGLCVVFGETRAAVIAISANAVAVQVPTGLEPGAVSVRAVNACGSETPLASEPIEMQIAETAPELFYSASDPEYVVAHPGADGSIRIYFTGVGLPESAPATGEMPAEALAAKAPVYLWLQGQELTHEQIRFAGWAPRAEGWASLKLPALFGDVPLLAPGLAVVEIVPPAEIGDAPWALTVKAGEVATTKPALLKVP